MITIHPQYLTLSKLLDGRLFRIPEYQRAYSWTSRERQDLFGDIEKVHAKGRTPVTSWLLWCAFGGRSRYSGPTSSTSLEVVDGQQRPHHADHSVERDQSGAESQGWGRGETRARAVGAARQSRR